VARKKVITKVDNLTVDYATTMTGGSNIASRKHYSIRGYSYPFQEAIYWLNRSSKNVIANIHNTHKGCVDKVKRVYELGTKLVLIPGCDEDDYSEQIYILAENLDSANELHEILKNEFETATIDREFLVVSNGQIEVSGLFLIADWSYSAKNGSSICRCKEEAQV